MNRNTCYFLITLFLIVYVGFVSGLGTDAQASNLDLLHGLGDFAKCNYSKVQGIDEFGVIPTSNLTVANGWITAIDLANKDLYLFNIVNSENFTRDGKAHMDSVKNYQYIGIINNPGHSQAAQISTAVKSNPKYLDETFRPSDSVVLHIDQIISSTFVSGRQSVAIGMFYMVDGDSTQHKQSISIDMSAGNVNNATFTLAVPNINYVRPYVQLYLGSNTTAGQTTGILLAGAKLFVVRNGQTVIDNEEMPVVRNRTIQTNATGLGTKLIPNIAIAKNYDYLCLPASEYASFSRLRTLNPTMKLYVYQSGMTAVDHFRPARWCVAPFKVDDLIARHPDWLSPQTNPEAKYDPDTGSNVYTPKYANVGGYDERFFISKVANTTYQDEWASRVIDLAKTTGADGVWIDDCTKMFGTTDKDGVWRYSWEVQQFLHGVIPKLKAAGLTSVVNSAEANLDGSASWNGDLIGVYFDPTWSPTSALTEAAGYSANTPDNTPDVFFREYSFIKNNFIYSSSYWLKCINDAKIVKDWNAALPAAKAKRIQYWCNERDTVNNPAYDKNGKAGWVPFVLASFLLCNNEFISLGVSISASDGSDSGAIADFTISKKLGIPDGGDVAINSNQYFRMRKYKADGEGSSGGIVVANGDTTRSYSFSLPFDAIDDAGTSHAAGSQVEFAPNMGRVFINTSPDMTVTMNASNTMVNSGEIITLTVTYLNNGKATAKNVLVQSVLPDGLKYVASSAEASGGSFNSTTNKVSWTIGEVAVGQTGTKTFLAQIN